MTNLELLDISHNSLTRIDQISFMPNLRILNITGNANLTKLPIQLTTCDSLTDIVLDIDFILYPPNNINEKGTSAILKYLLEQNGPHEEIFISNIEKTAQNIKKTTANMIEVERGKDVLREFTTNNDKYKRDKVGVYYMFY